MQLKNFIYKLSRLQAVLFALIIMISAYIAHAATPNNHDKDYVRSETKLMDVLDGVIAPEDENFAELVKKAYKLSTGDVLSIRVYNEDQLTGNYRIDAVGQILMPLIGKVDAMNKTASELALEIEVRFKEGYLNHPSVGVEIVQFRPFYLIGEVRTPGDYPYSYGLNVLKAVAIAGGYTYRANQKRVFIKREFNGQEHYIEADASTLIYPGDVITVKERFF